ncbi:AAA family ATPase [Mongoliitalea lutea]|uniref:Uncharacterized protein n=1 Tax=Mongoliitalea lutea TaxID=849756 RepID=A0A8J3CY75_9BACT|nr:AAA family ATPase [Mongoliitalea lutea]GHB43593.1 hypothetical protein GCM10008106_25710 [Mongoliitalea lutea]
MVRLYMGNLRFSLTLPRFGDFMVDETYVFEVGGPSKTSEQIQGVPNAYLVEDDIKFGNGKKIPLWLFGFLF